MPAFALAHLRNPQVNEDILTYLERIQATLEPFGGRFVVHGPEVDVREGEWPGSVVILEFPDRQQAHAWYDSPAYQEILPLRTRHIDASAIIFDGVGPGYDPGQTAAALRAQAATG
ncbi:DUF1330 domain-containing protein [Verrucosispora sp. WMMD573]|uniref:DUF1330 domain-containing protein n=1 Tax=Verrucosispora sp. WMMD573 TaxID=3015149 RepID=UPI00248BE2A3|nr:DUF1330 domain-containing protein [Verrucosispora sp. WMMD573]WBB56747.1 DUF1330 domain-containing protein [Verrucosispora sp. WMMD573]